MLPDPFPPPPLLVVSIGGGEGGGDEDMAADLHGGKRASGGQVLEDGAQSFDCHIVVGVCRASMRLLLVVVVVVVVVVEIVIGKGLRGVTGLDDDSGRGGEARAENEREETRRENGSPMARD